MLVSIALGSALLIVTTFVHAAAMVITARLFVFSSKELLPRQRWTRPAQVAIVVLIMFIASVAEALVWALVYLWLGAIEEPATAMYFSMVTYTTLGYGDVTLEESWRLLSSFQAANGTIIFGWSTAIIVAAVHRRYVYHGHDAEQRAST